MHHQYCGQLGKQANCQAAVTLSIANHQARLPIAYRLYLPRAWINDRSRRAKAHVPRAIRFKTKRQIALEQIRAGATLASLKGRCNRDGHQATDGGDRVGNVALGPDQTGHWEIVIPVAFASSSGGRDRAHPIGVKPSAPSRHR